MTFGPYGCARMFHRSLTRKLSQTPFSLCFLAKQKYHARQFK
jgi:hypothetical protein